MKKILVTGGTTFVSKYVADITAYDAQDIIDLYNALDSFEQYIMISSSAVYPEYCLQPFLEESIR